VKDGDGSRLSATLVTLVAVGLLLWLLAEIAQILLLLFISMLLAVYFDAATDVVARRVRVSRWISLPVVLAVSIGAALGIGALILPPVVNQTQDLAEAFPDLLRRFENLITALAERYPFLARTSVGRQPGGLVESALNDAAAFAQRSVFPYVTAGGRGAVEGLSVLAMALYLAADPATYREGIVALCPPKYRHVARTVGADLRDTWRAWVWAQLLAMLVLGVLTWLGLLILRVPYALSFGVLSGIAAIVPFFGSIVATLIPALYMATVSGWSAAIGVGVLGVVIHVLEANAIRPLIFQDRLKLPPVLTILSVLVTGKLLGPLGLLVAVPLLATGLVVFRHVLLVEIYGDRDPRSSRSALLVTSTGEQRAIVVDK